MYVFTYMRLWTYKLHVLRKKKYRYLDLNSIRGFFHAKLNFKFKTLYINFHGCKNLMNSCAMFRRKFQDATKEFKASSAHQLNKPELLQIFKTQKKLLQCPFEEKCFPFLLKLYFTFKILCHLLEERFLKYFYASSIPSI